MTMRELWEFVNTTYFWFVAIGLNIIFSLIMNYGFKGFHWYIMTVVFLLSFVVLFLCIWLASWID